MTTFTLHQDQALRAVADWLKAKPGKNGTPPVFRLFGYAGTGKTTLARHIADGVNGNVKFAAFTGKAALVMRNKGCDNASTIHSLIYRTRESGEEQPSFELWDDAPASKAKLIVIDVCSMVDAELGRDLMSFDCPLLVLGDPAQLPPIQGGGFFTDAEPDAMLTEVHRQAQDDPIVRMSMAVREGRALDLGTFGESEVVRRDALDIARTAFDRSVWFAYEELLRTYHLSAAGQATAADVKAKADRCVALVRLFAETLELHSDFSLSESMDHIVSVEKVRNPAFEHVFFENSACRYCLSHQAEYAKGWYVPSTEELAALLVARAEAGDFSPLPPFPDYRAKLRALPHPIRAFAPDPSRRTPENFRRLMLTAADVLGR